MNQNYIDLNDYVYCTDKLVEAIQKDVKTGYRISESTLIALTKLITASHKAATMLSVMKNINNKLN